MKLEKICNYLIRVEHKCLKYFENEEKVYRFLWNGSQKEWPLKNQSKNASSFMQKRNSSMFMKSNDMCIGVKSKKKSIDFNEIRARMHRFLWIWSKMYRNRWNQSKRGSFFHDIKWKMHRLLQNRSKVNRFLWIRCKTYWFRWNRSKCASTYMQSEQTCIDFYEIWPTRKNDTLVFFRPDLNCTEFYQVRANVDQLWAYVKLQKMELALNSSIQQKEKIEHVEATNPSVRICSVPIGYDLR